MGDHSEDIDLVGRMLDGDAAAFESFGALYFRALYRFALGRLGGDRELAREIVQMTLTRALAKIEGYRGEAALFTWLCACCRNEMKMHFRARGSRPIEVDLEEDQEAGAGARSPASPDPERELLGRERRALVHAALDAVPERYARVLEWKYLEGLPVDEIAGRLDLGLKAAESLLTRARAAFRKVYDPIGGPPIASVANPYRGGSNHERTRAAT